MPNIDITLEVLVDDGRREHGPWTRTVKLPCLPGDSDWIEIDGLCLFVRQRTFVTKSWTVSPMLFRGDSCDMGCRHGWATTIIQLCDATGPTALERLRELEKAGTWKRKEEE